jgi:putative oxidoreductase
MSFTVELINVVNIQIISRPAKHHSKQLWINVSFVNVLTKRSGCAMSDSRFGMRDMRCFSHPESHISYRGSLITQHFLNIASKIQKMKIASTRYSDSAISFSALVLRLSLGLLMLILHGWNKLQHFSENSHNNFFDPLHIGTMLSFLLIVFAEVFCSLFIALGLFTRLACIPLIIEMLVIIFVMNHGVITPKVSEKEVLFLTGYLALIFMGPGRVSVDRLLGK